jgi:hypothetical protein
MSFIPKALAAILAPMDLPTTDVRPFYSPLREIIVHGGLCGNLAGFCARRPSTTNKKNEDNSTEFTPMKIKPLRRPADLV